jgi:hypothetical protein
MMSETNLTGNVCVLIMSCDKYDDLWEPFFQFFDKYWPDCPYPVYLATNTKSYNHQNVTVIHSDHKGTWSEETLIILDRLPYEQIIYLQDDYFLTQKVNNKIIGDIIVFFNKYKVNYLRLFPSPGSDSDFENEQAIGLINKESAYRTSLQCAVWDKKTFINLLEPDESQWQFEINAGFRSKDYLFLSYKINQKGHIKSHIYPITYYYLTAVIRGKWRWGAAKICKKENVVLDFSRRDKESFFEMSYQKIYNLAPLFLRKILDYSVRNFSK